MPQIVLDNASKFYGATRALEDVRLAIEDDATTAVVGPSGSGKSTLLQLINGLVRPTRGRVLVFGRAVDYHNLPRLRRQIAYAVQGVGLFPHMTAWNNITLLARLERWSAERIAQRVETLISLVGLDHGLTRRFPHELSGGQQQRVGLCRAMMLNPTILLLDEPFGALDPITRGDIHQEFLSLQKSEARTIVLVTHDLREAFKLADRIVVIDKGRILREGTCDEVANDPRDAVVADLLRTQLDDGGSVGD